MSYILDALKKSELQRGHGAIPNVQTVHSSSLHYRDEKKTYWPYILITAVILNLIAIVYFIIDTDDISENNTTTVGDTVIDNNTEKTVTVKNIETIAPAAMPDNPARNTAGTNTKTETAKTKTVVAATVKPIKKKTKPANKHPAQTQKEIIDFYDLPISIQQQLPTITVSAHVYSSNPLQRSIVINNNFLEEGEYVIDNLVIYEITADGAIFDFEDTRFRYSVVSGWQ